ncbi:zinc ABC transporter substrate-binding protein [uncultured Victivallis sp.]|uniref:metal ABC transporter solute-binding protein, Zn/Mn family n=1 Tax=uncultured Victivallis sp. TaxID=354118 RepID=UPI002593D132|nr:zinc ABC transporter substrate-binding protein [uncultured Victivallis sp.]
MKMIPWSAFAVTLCLTLLGVAGCGDSGDGTDAASGKLSVYTGLPPIAFMAARIGGDAVSVKSVLPEGRSPHDYSPSPRDIKGVASATLFLTTRMVFEKALTRPFEHSKIRIVDVSAGVPRIPFDGAGCTDPTHHHDHVNEADHNHPGDHPEHYHHDDGCSDDGLDPHIWLSLANDRIIAENICRAFSEAAPAHAAEFRRNTDALKAQLAELEMEIREKLTAHKGGAFYVYHPAFGYFSAMTGLKQVAVEKGGREVTPAHFADVIRRARADKIKVIFIQPQFNPASAKALADAVGGKVVELDPLASDLPANFRKMADALVNGFTEEKGR